MVSTSIRAACPSCRKNLRVPAGFAGQRVSCKACESSFTVPERIAIACPNCRHDLNVRVETIGMQAKCKHCQQTFRIPSNDVEPTPAAAATPAPTAPPDAGVSDLLARQFEEVRTQRDRLNEEVHSLRSQLHAAKSEGTTHVERLRLEIGTAANERDRLVGELRDLQVTLESLRSDVDRLGDLELAQADLTAERDRLADEVREALGQLETLRADLEVSRQSQTEADTLRLDLASLRTELEAARQAAYEAESLRNGEASGADADGLRGERDRLVDELSATTNRLASLETESQAYGQLAQEFDAVRAERDRLVEELRQTLEQLETQREAMERFSRLVEELDVVRAERDRMTEDVRDLAARLEIVSIEAQQVGRLALEHEAISAERDRLQDEVHTLRGQFDVLHAEVDAMRKAPRPAPIAVPAVETSGELVSLRQETETLRREREAAMKKLAALGQERDQIEAARQQAEQKYQSVVSRGNEVFSKARQHVETLTTRNTSLAEEVNTLRSELANLRSRHRENERQELQQALALAALGKDRTHMVEPAEPATARSIKPNDPDSLRADLERYLAKTQRFERPKIDPSSIPDPFAILHTDFALDQLVADESEL